jgi:hypothetical protein
MGGDGSCETKERGEPVARFVPHPGTAMSGAKVSGRSIVKSMQDRAFHLDIECSGRVTFPAPAARHNRNVTMASFRLKRFLPILVLVLAACDDPFGPGAWVAAQDTLTMYSASRAEYVGMGSALDAATEPVTVLPIEVPGATGNWDIALIEDASGLLLAPAGTFTGLGDNRSRIAVLEGQDFATLEEAPSDTTRYSSVPVRVRTGVVYVLRTRKAQCGLTSGYRYAKMRVISIDAARGLFSFVITRNPYCDDRSLVPPDIDD